MKERLVLFLRFIFLYLILDVYRIGETIRCMSASGNGGITRIGEPFHRAQLKINDGDSRQYLNRIFSHTGSTRTVLPVFGCNFSLATGRQGGTRGGPGRRVLVYCLTRPGRAGIEYRVCINDDTALGGKKKAGQN